MVCEGCSGRPDLDPKVIQLIRKVMLLKRIMAKYPAIVIKARSVLCAYTIQGNKRFRNYPWL